MQAAEPIVRKRLTQAELDVICARHDRLFQARPGGASARSEEHTSELQSH